MTTNFNNPPPPKTPEETPSSEGVKELRDLFDWTEKALEERGRESARILLPYVYNELIALNKWDKANWLPMTWNKDGFLTEEEFNELNLRRKKLSNAVGRLMADGTIDHDINKI